MRDPILIIGAHRSGTTATARALALLGLQLGHRWDSHHEPKGLQRLHEHYLEQVGASWHNPAPFLASMQTTEGTHQCAEYLRANIEKNFARIFNYRSNPTGLWLRARRIFGAAWGWKEPRTTLFATAWREIFPQARFVHVIRHPKAAAMSIRQRELDFRAKGDPPIADLDDLDYCVQLVRTYIEAGERLDHDTARYRRFQFEDLQANPAATLEDLADFCELRFPRARLVEAAATIRPRVG